MAETGRRVSERLVGLAPGAAQEPVKGLLAASEQGQSRPAGGLHSSMAVRRQAGTHSRGALTMIVLLISAVLTHLAPLVQPREGVVLVSYQPAEVKKRRASALCSMATAVGSAACLHLCPRLSLHCVLCAPQWQRARGRGQRCIRRMWGLETLLAGGAAKTAQACPPKVSRVHGVVPLIPSAARHSDVVSC